MALGGALDRKRGTLPSWRLVGAPPNVPASSRSRLRGYRKPIEGFPATLLIAMFVGPGIALAIALLDPRDSNFPWYDPEMNVPSSRLRKQY